jgi:hypothetical protein
VQKLLLGARIRAWLMTAITGLAIARVGLAQEAARPEDRIVFSGSETDRCLVCHAMPNFGYRDAAGLTIRSFTVARDAFRRSAHGVLNCQQCHSEITAYPHEFSTRRARVSCDKACHAADAAGRPYSHRQAVADFALSAHGKSLTGEDPKSPTCTTCHGGDNPHAIPRIEKARSPATAIAFCIRCHDDRPLMEKHHVPAGAVTSYRRSFHYKAIEFGDTRTAACPDCHTAHRILPAKDPRSTVAPGQLTQTCGQKGCHADARRNFAVSGANHLDLRVDREPVLYIEEKLFVLLTIGTMGMLVAGIALDVQRKFGWIVLAGSLVHRVGRTRVPLARFGRRVLRVGRYLLWD